MEPRTRVFASLAESFPGIDWKKLADYMVGRVVVHGERRAREMDEVARTLEELGIEPMMAAATARRMDWAADLGLRETFGGEFPKTYQEVLDAIAEMLRPKHDGLPLDRLRERPRRSRALRLPGLGRALHQRDVSLGHHDRQYRRLQFHWFLCDLHGAGGPLHRRLLRCASS